MRRLGWLPLIAIFLSALLLPLGAYGRGADDPFLPRHSELLRAAETLLEQLRTQPANPARPRLHNPQAVGRPACFVTREVNSSTW